jgi:hypothetical protein
MVSSGQSAQLMTDLQFSILVTIPLFGILWNAASMIYVTASLGRKIESFRSSVDTRFDVVMSKLGDLDTRISVLED